MDKKRFRIRFVFWLDLQKPDENQIAEQIDTLKQERAFAKVVRDGIRLVSDLRKGKVDVLLELFPWIEDYFAYQKSMGGGSYLALQEQLARLEQKLLQEGAKPIDRPGPELVGPKPMQVPKVVVPTFDDDDDLTFTVKKSVSTGNQAAHNFLNSLRALG